MVASTCMTIYKTVYMCEYFDEEGVERTVLGRLNKEERDGLVFRSKDFASVTLPICLEAIRWLETRAYFDDVRIAHTLNGGEYKVLDTAYFVDGYDFRSRTIYSYHGCAFHRCIPCFPDRYRRTGVGGIPHEVYERTMKRQKRLETLGYQMITAWGHEMKDLPDYQKIYFNPDFYRARLSSEEELIASNCTLKSRPTRESSTPISPVSTHGSIHIAPTPRDTPKSS